MNKKIAYVLGAIALLIGLWGFYNRFAFGDENAAYGSIVVWGLWVALYFFFGGIAVGCFIWASLDLLFEIPALKGTGRPALWAALVNLTAGMAAIGLDIGHMERIIKAYLQPNFHSGIAQDVWGYTIFGLLALIALILAVKQPKNAAVKIVMALGLVVALYVAGAPGKLMGDNATRMYWHAGMIPVQFLFFALTTGAAMLLVIRGFFGMADEKQFSVLNISAAVLLVINLYFVWAYYSQSLAGNMPDLVNPINAVLYGQYSTLFWGVQIIFGAILPIVVLTQRRVAGGGALVGLMGLFILLGNVVARYLILIPAQQVELLDGLSTAFTGRGFSLAYAPSTTEWAVASGLLGVVILGLLVGADLLLPLFTKSQKEA
ncbi:MAG: polysulfide reductase NrfD [Chloroflexi bacterium]|nr:polysulfide reductase NrfD [Chloroflexota bacterium]